MNHSPSTAPPSALPTERDSATRDTPDDATRVLLVDDDPVFRRSIARALRAHGFLVDDCGTPKEAIEHLHHNLPHVIVADIHMPEMNGVELAARIASNGLGNTPMLLMTGDTHIDLTPDSLAIRSVSGLLYKPLALEVLVQALERARRSVDADPESVRGSAAPPSGERFLVLEDDPVDRALLNVLFRRSGYADRPRDTVTDLEQAVEKLRDQVYTHVLANITLMDQRPEEIVLRLRSLNRRVPLLVLAEDNDPDLAASLIRLGADEYVVKEEVEGRTFRQLLDHAAERRSAQQRLLYACQHDAVTGLMNSRLFQDRLAREVADARRAGNSAALMLIKLEDFAMLASSLGSRGAEQLLRSSAKLLTLLVAKGSLAYLGSECFGALLPQEASGAPFDARPILRRLEGALRQRVIGVAPKLRAGVAILGSASMSATGLLAAARQALEEATRDNQEYRVYDEALAQVIARRQWLQGELGQALDLGEISLHFQPKVQLASGRLAGVEALMRWRRRGVENVSPAEFIPLLEQSGQITSFGYWAIERACMQVRSWLDAHGTLLPVAVNLSGRQFHDADLLERIAAALDRAALPPHALQLEVTESSLLRDIPACIDIMRRLKRLGIGLAIDDFGTGYSSMAYLKQFPFDCLKIDRCFVQDLATDSKTRAVASGIVALGKALGVELIAEGIEEREQLEILRDVGCEIGQGYLLGRPSPPEALPPLLSKSLAAAD